MKLKDSLLLVLYLMGGKSPTQFVWNLQTFLVYMWASEYVPMHDCKFKATSYGPFCHKIATDIDYLYEKKYITDSYSNVAYVPEVDTLINEEFFDDTTTFELTEKGKGRVEYIADIHHIDLTNSALLNIMYTPTYVDTPWLFETIKHNFPEQIKRKKKRH